MTLRVTGPAHRRSTIVVDADRMGRRGRDRARPPRGQEAAAAAGALEEPLAAASAEEPESAEAAPESADASDSPEDSELLDPDGVELPVVAESVE